MDYLPASCSLFCRFSQSYAKKLNPESPTMKRIRRAQLKKFSMIINIIAILLLTKKPTGQMLQFFPSISLCIKKNCKLFVGLKRWRWVKKIKSPHDDAKLQRACGQHIFPFFRLLSFSLLHYYCCYRNASVWAMISIFNIKSTLPLLGLCQASKQVQRKSDERKSLLLSVGLGPDATPCLLLFIMGLASEVYDFCLFFLKK